MKVKINAISLIFCRVGSDFLSLLLFVGISRHFGPAGVGEFSYGFAIATLVFVIASLGIDTYGVRHFLQLAPLQRSAWMAELLGTQVVMSSISVVGLGGYLLLTGPTPAKLAVILALTTYQVLVALARTMFIPAIARERMVLPAIADVICRAVAVGVAIVAIERSSSSVAVSLLGFPVAGALLLVVAAISAIRYGITLRIRISTQSPAQHWTNPVVVRCVGGRCTDIRTARAHNLIRAGRRGSDGALCGWTQAARAVLRAAGVFGRCRLPASRVST